MSGLAEILLKEHFQISGSDSKETPLTLHLQTLGASILYGQKASNITDGISAVIYTAAIHDDNEELCEAKRRGIPLLSRAELLGQLMTNYQMPIAISGTHGKTTSTSMLSHILLADNQDPTISVGGILDAIKGNIRVGSSELFVTEACEYTNSFLHFFPKISVILNVDADHLDFFKDIYEIRSSFHKFASLLPPDGVLVINSEIEQIEEITEGLSCKVVTYGFSPSADYNIVNMTHNKQGNASFDIVKKDNPGFHLDLSVGGEHNISNAAAAIAVAEQLHISESSIQKGLASFAGTKRRFEYKGERSGILIIDDYAHHPTEITASLKAAANFPHKELWCIFQPHTYSRTKALFDDFINSLSLADHVVLADIYAARENDALGVSSAQLAAALLEKGCDACYLPSFEAIESYCLEHCQKGDMLITMGAGDVVNIGENLLKQ